MGSRISAPWPHQPSNFMENAIDDGKNDLPLVSDKGKCVSFRLDLELQLGSVCEENGSRGILESRDFGFSLQYLEWLNIIGIPHGSKCDKLRMYDQIILDVAVACCSYVRNPATSISPHGLFSAASSARWCQMGQKD